jgi:hypothetical protein
MPSPRSKVHTSRDAIIPMSVKRKAAVRPTLVSIAVPYAERLTKRAMLDDQVRVDDPHRRKRIGQRDAQLTEPRHTAAKTQLSWRHEAI